MPSRPAFQFYPKDFLTDAKVAVMSLQARGAYITLLCHCWLEGELPNDERQLQRLAGLTTEEWAEVWLEVEPCFVSNGNGRLRNKRLDRERKKQDAYRKMKSEAGKKGARNRWKQKELDGSATDLPLANDGSPSPSSSPSSSPTSDSSTTPPPTPSPACAGAIAGDRVNRVWQGHIEARRIYFTHKNGYAPSNLPALTTKLRKAIRGAIKEHGDEAAFAAGRGIFLSDFHTGKNAEERTFLTPDLCWRMNSNSDNVERFSELYFAAKDRKR